MRRPTHVLFALMVGVCSVESACDGALTVDEGVGSDPLWTGNGPACPPEPPDAEESCSAEKEICAYYRTDASTAQVTYTAFACREATGGTLLWHRYQATSGALVCPATEPATGAACSGYRGQSCPYPVLGECTCPSEGAAEWSCQDNRPKPTAPPPNTLDASTPVKDLTPAERQVWCEWFAVAMTGEGAPQPPESPLSAEGYTTNTGFTVADEFFCSGCVPVLPVSYCVGNLALSSCSAPIAELTDCVITLHDDCWPYQHGCARYLDRAGCQGTIIGGAAAEGGGGSAGENGSCPIDVQ